MRAPARRVTSACDLTTAARVPARSPSSGRWTGALLLRPQGPVLPLGRSGPAEEPTEAGGPGAARPAPAARRPRAGSHAGLPSRRAAASMPRATPGRVASARPRTPGQLGIRVPGPAPRTAWTSRSRRTYKPCRAAGGGGRLPPARSRERRRPRPALQAARNQHRLRSWWRAKPRRTRSSWPRAMAPASGRPRCCSRRRAWSLASPARQRRARREGAPGRPQARALDEARGRARGRPQGRLSARPRSLGGAPSARRPYAPSRQHLLVKTHPILGWCSEGADGRNFMVRSSASCVVTWRSSELMAMPCD
mmetsp:Transcript_118542/g.368420  ORF Transcript_118542/g.368420 Transcript_118542/m.368420 type:complete len:308 (-) Transcript_118542:148-1071(-)